MGWQVCNLVPRVSPLTDSYSSFSSESYQDWTQVNCLISTSNLAGFFDIFILLHIWQNCVCWLLFTNEDTVMLTMRNLNIISVQSWTYLESWLGNSNLRHTSRTQGKADWLIWFRDLMIDVREVIYTESSFLGDHFNTYPTVHCAIVVIFYFLSFSVLTATNEASQRSQRKAARGETRDADIRIDDTRGSVSRDCRTPGPGCSKPV